MTIAHVFSTGVACERSCRPFSFCLPPPPRAPPDGSLSKGSWWSFSCCTAVLASYFAILQLALDPGKQRLRFGGQEGGNDHSAYIYISYHIYIYIYIYVCVYQCISVYISLCQYSYIIYINTCECCCKDKLPHMRPQISTSLARRVKLRLSHDGVYWIDLWIDLKENLKERRVYPIRYCGFFCAFFSVQLHSRRF